MTDLAISLPRHRPELVFSPATDAARFVVKDPRAGEYFGMGAEEFFLLQELDGTQSSQAICNRFHERFGQPLSTTELAEFVELAAARGFLENSPTVSPRAAGGSTASPSRPTGSSLIYSRKSLFDPDRLFNWLEPKLRFVWTRGFLVFSLASMALAALMLVVGRHQLAGSLSQAARWETAFAVAIVLFLVTVGHEFAHGLTCKHYGGEVHEVGLLLLLLMPFMYCNVSDAWLFQRKSHRLWVTLAGGYFELFLWSLAVFAWRVTTSDTLINFLSFVVMSVCGVRTFFNLNPLVKLDGYYLLSDMLDVPNLHARAIGRFKAQVRRLMWGARCPEADPLGRWLTAFGLASWLCSLAFISMMVVAMFRFTWPRWGWPAAFGVGFLGLIGGRGLLHDLTAGEIRQMLTARRKRAGLWLSGVTGVAAALWLVQIPDRAGGSFRVRPATRAELRAPVAGFLSQVFFDEGDRVPSAALVAKLDVADLDTRLAQKQAELDEAQAQLRLLEIGPRPEEVAEQRLRVERMRAWTVLAETDLAHAQQALQEELERLDHQISEFRVELAAAQDDHRRAQAVRAKGAFAEEQFRDSERRSQVTQAKLAQVRSQKRHRLALGTREAIAGLDAEAELARRRKDLADAQAALTLMEAGSRPEEIAAQTARLARLQEEVKHLHQLREKQAVTTPLGGRITTARLKEKVGQYLHEGDVICVVEDANALEVEITLAEQDVASIAAGQDVELKARALPFETFTTRVDRIAPAAGPGDVQSKIIVYCRLPKPPAELRSEMTGYARIYTGQRSIGAVAVDRLVRFVRTEFWW